MQVFVASEVKPQAQLSSRSGTQLRAENAGTTTEDAEAAHIITE